MSVLRVGYTIGLFGDGDGVRGGSKAVCGLVRHVRWGLWVGERQVSRGLCRLKTCSLMAVCTL